MAADGALGPFWLDMVREHGIILHAWMVMTPRVFVADPLVIKEMVTDFKRFPKAGENRGFLARKFSFGLQRMGTTNFCGYNSILTDLGGPIWKRKKKIMDPAFSIQRLTKHLPKFYDIAISLCDAVGAAQQSSPETPVDVTGIMSPFTVDAISKAGFSATENQVIELRQSNEDLKGGFTKIVSKGGNVFALMCDAEARKCLSTNSDNIRRIRRLARQLIMDRTSNGQFGVAEDILDSIINANIDEASGGLDMEDSLDDFMAMYAAGNATTSTTLLWCLGELVRNPAVMDKLVDEIDEVWIGSNVDSTTNPSVIGDTLKQMTYLEAFVKEVLRYHPPVQFILRKTGQQVKLCGYNLPAGTTLLSSQYVLHHFEQYWSDPDKFEPERFLTTSPKPYTYIPFFLGPRKCIGKNFAILELKCILCELLSRFEVEKDPDTPLKQRSRQGFLCYPIDNFYIIKPRF
ncbi:cholesterol 24-hydroxylase-like [Bolinopsis microptera]|uniref:cholesterol 24-hydroxylase-like n=1 Tax=Bolinopsis microptera TaxID=2820187 RepID=UPI00307A38E7